MALIGKIRGMRMRDGNSISEISRLPGLSRNTIKQWLQTPQRASPQYRRRDVSTKLAPFIATLTQALEVDARRSKHERRTACALHVQPTSQGCDGGHAPLTDFIRQWRNKPGKLISARAFVPLASELGEAFQFDWSEEGLAVGGIYHRMQVSHLKLYAWRAFWLVAYPSQDHEMLFDAHTRSFAAMGGIARRGIHDLHVDRGRQGQEGQGPHRQQALRRDVRAFRGSLGRCATAHPWPTRPSRYSSCAGPCCATRAATA